MKKKIQKLELCDTAYKAGKFCRKDYEALIEKVNEIVELLNKKA